MSSKNDINQTDQLTILQVLPELKVGGVERGTVEFSVYLKQQGHHPIVVSAGGPLVSELESHGIVHIKLNVKKKSLSSLQSVNKLKKVMIKERVDVVHARSRIPAWLCAFALRRIKNYKPRFVTTLHGLHSINRYSAIMATGDAVIAVSHAAEKYLLNNFNKYLKKPPTVIHRGVDPEFRHGYQASDEWQELYAAYFDQQVMVKTVLMPGRLSQVKGIEHLIPWLKTTVHTCKLLITAMPDESNYSRKVNQLFKQHNLSDHLIWLGIERDMPALYSAVDLVVSVNNKPESFGRTVLESLSIGTPVVAFSHGGVEEIMTQLFPVGLVRQGNEKALSQRIDEFLTELPVVKKHQLFTNLTMFEKTMQVYRNLMNSDEVN